MKGKMKDEGGKTKRAVKSASGSGRVKGVRGEARKKASSAKAVTRGGEASEVMLREVRAELASLRQMVEKLCAAPASADAAAGANGLAG